MMGKRLFLRLALPLILAGILAIPMVLPEPALAMGGSGTQADPYIIYNVTDLQNIENDLTAWYELGNDIDASVTSTWNGGLGFDPIGTWTEPKPPSACFYVSTYNSEGFSGHFDGKGYTISGLFIEREENDFGSPYQESYGIGLFLALESGATVQNVTLLNVDITGYSNTGGLAGSIKTGSSAITVSSVTVTGSVTGTLETGGLIGEIAGCSSGDIGVTIDSSVSLATVTGQDEGEVSSNYCGGFIGNVAAYGGILIKDSNATGNVTSTGRWSGGFIGYIHGLTSGSPIEIKSSYATGDVTSSDSEVGGFVGYADGYTDFLFCYATGDVESTGASDDYVGGFVGQSKDNVSYWICYAEGNVTAVDDLVGGFGGHVYGDIINAYAKGNVTGDAYIGGFVGALDGALTYTYSTGVPSGNSGVGGLVGEDWGADGVTGSFWDKETSGTETSDGGTGETTANMKTESTFTSAGWDFIMVWAIDLTQAINDGYPYFGQEEANEFLVGPSALLALPISSVQINLTWIKGYMTDGTTPTIHTEIWYKVGGWPLSRSDSTKLYRGDAELFNHKGLTAGTTYYYKAWAYLPDSDEYSPDWDRDFATTLLGDPSGPLAPPMPGEWFQDPSCEAYGSVPGYELLINLSDSMSMPFGTMCLISTVFLVVGASAAGLVLGGTMIGLGAMAVGILAASIAGLLPMWFLLVALVLGISLAFAWTRA